LVSIPWKTAIVEMEKDLGENNVNEGKRTLARQRWFWDCMNCNCCNNGNLAAFPSPWAPHIRVGRIDHAIDFADGPKAERWLDSHGIRAWRTVPGESWHTEVDAGDLKRFHREHVTDIYDTLPKHVEHAVRMLLYHRRQAIDEAKSENGGKGPKYERHVRRRKFWRRRVEGFLRRSRRDRTKRVLRKVLAID
jgi:hypothetical protein